MTKLEAIKELVKHDHAFLKPEFAKAICEPFGVKAPIYLAKANPQEPKGLTLVDDNGNLIDEAYGADADQVAKTIADYLQVPYTSMHGRGSRLRECCEAILAYLNKTKTPPESEVK